MKVHRFQDDCRDGRRLNPRSVASPVRVGAIAAGVAIVLSLAASQIAGAQVVSPKVKIYLTTSLLYPFVQVYFRTLDQDRNPFVNLTIANVGIMVLATCGT